MLRAVLSLKEMLAPVQVPDVLDIKAASVLHQELSQKNKVDILSVFLYRPTLDESLSSMAYPSLN